MIFQSIHKFLMHCLSKMCNKTKTFWYLDPIPAISYQKTIINWIDFVGKMSYLSLKWTFREFMYPIQSDDTNYSIFV